MKALKLLALITLILILFGILTSCSAEWHLRRAVKKNITLFDTVRTTQIDTVFNEVEAVDTAFVYIADTLIEYIQVTKEGDVKIRYIHDTLTDTVRIEVDCPDCEDIVVTNTEKVTVYVEPKWWTLLKKFWIWPIIILAIYLIIRKLA